MRARLGRPLLSPPVGRLALELVDLIAEQFPAEALATLLEARQVRLLGPEAARPRRAFLEAGVRDDELGATAEAGAYEVRLSELRARTSDDARRRALEALTTSVSEVLVLLRSLPEQAPGLELVDAFWHVLSKLGLIQRSPERVGRRDLDDAAHARPAGPGVRTQAVRVPRS